MPDAEARGYFLHHRSQLTPIPVPGLKSQSRATSAGFVAFGTQSTTATDLPRENAIASPPQTSQQRFAVKFPKMTIDRAG